MSRSIHPSAYLDVENRACFATLIRRFALNNQKTVVIVEHDISMIANEADNTIYVEGIPGKEGKLSEMLTVQEGLSKFLGQLGVTMRSDKQTGRPRLNKRGGQQDKSQKERGILFEI